MVAEPLSDARAKKVRTLPNQAFKLHTPSTQKHAQLAQGPKSRHGRKHNKKLPSRQTLGCDPAKAQDTFHGHDAF